MTARAKARSRPGHAAVVSLNGDVQRPQVSLFADLAPCASSQTKEPSRVGMMIAPVSTHWLWRFLRMSQTTETPEAPCSAKEGPRRHLRRFLNFRRQRGQSLVEVALVLPMLLVVLVGTIEVGRFSYYSILVANAARAGAVYGAQNLATAKDFNGIQSAAKNDGQNVAGLTVDTPVVLCGCINTSLTAACPASGCALPNHPLVYIQVTARGSFNGLFSYPGVPASITVVSTQEMRVAQ
jgi:Flp pilus assembly protein TadG